MQTPSTLLILGSSNMTFRSDGSSTSQLLQTELSDLEHRGWLVLNVDLAPGRRMAAKAAALCDENRPDVALLSLNAQPSVYESVLIKVGRRWPRALGLVTRIESFLRPTAAGKASGFSSMVYRSAQAIGLALIGGETALAVEHHVENVASCLQRLAALEDTPILVRLPVGGAQVTPARRRRYEQRLGRLKGGVIDACRRYRIPYVDVAARLAESRRTAGHGADNVHLDVETRRFEARVLASEIVAISLGTPSPPADDTRASEAPAVHRDSLIRDIAPFVRAQEYDRVRYVGRLADVAKRHAFVHLPHIRDPGRKVHQLQAHVGVDQPRRDDIHANAVLALLLRQRRSQGLHAGLGDVVGHGVRAQLLRRLRRDHDDVAAGEVPHLRHQKLAHVQAAHGVVFD
jgi:hypothetical protein